MRFISCIAAALVLASVGEGARAEEAPAAAANPPEAESGIAAAKRDFDSVKAARETSAASARGEMPRIALPDFSVAPADPRPTLAPSTATPLGAKSPNWLLDAMQKKSEANHSDRNDVTSRDERSRGHALLPGESLRDSEEAVNSTEQDSREKSATSERDASAMPSRSAAAALNPLARYMGVWMTPQDFTLLQPTLGNVKDNGGPTSALALPGTDGGVNQVGAFDFTSDLDRGTAAANLPAVPRENPFLQTLNAPPAPPTIALPVPAPASSTPASLFVPPPEPPRAKSAIPDFAKPGSDEKYFKPLKRF